MASALTEPDPGLGATSLSLLGSSSSHVEPQRSCAANSSACWPHMFLVGAQKSATTSLFDLFHRNGAACGTSYLPDQGMFKPRHQFFSPKEVHLFDAPPDEFAEVVREPATRPPSGWVDEEGNISFKSVGAGFSSGALPVFSFLGQSSIRGVEEPW